MVNVSPGWGVSKVIIAFSETPLYNYSDCFYHTYITYLKQTWIGKSIWFCLVNCHSWHMELPYVCLAYSPSLFIISNNKSKYIITYSPMNEKNYRVSSLLLLLPWLITKYTSSEDLGNLKVLSSHWRTKSKKKKLEFPTVKVGLANYIKYTLQKNHFIQIFLLWICWNESRPWFYSTAWNWVLTVQTFKCLIK